MDKTSEHSTMTRPDSSKIIEVHVYLVPPDIYRERFNNVLNAALDYTISFGFIRVHIDTILYGVRDVIAQQIGFTNLPRNYVFLKGVGRSLTRVKAKQEYQLKIKNFCPPLAHQPEIYLLELTPDLRLNLSSPGDVSSSGTSAPNGESPRFHPRQSGNDRSSYDAYDADRDATPYKHSTSPYKDSEARYHYQNYEWKQKDVLPQIYSKKSANSFDEHDKPLNYQEFDKLSSSNAGQSEHASRIDNLTPLPAISSGNSIAGRRSNTAFTPDVAKSSHFVNSVNVVQNNSHNKNNNIVPEISNSYNEVPEVATNETQKLDPVNGDADHLIDKDANSNFTPEDNILPTNNSEMHQMQSPQNDFRDTDESEHHHNVNVLSESDVSQLSHSKFTEDIVSGEDETNNIFFSEPYVVTDDSKTNILNYTAAGDVVENLNEVSINNDQDVENNDYDNVQTPVNDMPSPVDSYVNQTETDIHQTLKNSPNHTDLVVQTIEPTSPELYHSSNTHEQSDNEPLDQTKTQENYDPLADRVETDESQLINPDDATTPHASLENGESYKFDDRKDSRDNSPSDIDQRHSGQYESQRLKRHDDEHRHTEDNSEDEKIDQNHHETDSRINGYGNDINEDRRNFEERYSGESEERGEDPDHHTPYNNNETTLPLPENDQLLSIYDEKLLDSQSSDVISDVDKANLKQQRSELNHEQGKAREDRRQAEKKREELVKKAKILQTKMQNRRNFIRDVWKKRYFEEKKKTAPLEDQASRHRIEIEQIHQKLMNYMETPKEIKHHSIPDGPSEKTNLKISAIKLQHENADLQRKIDTCKMKLTAEMKLRNQAETELKSLRSDLIQKKINLTLTRSQQFGSLTNVLNPPENPFTAPQNSPRSENLVG